MAKKDQNIEAQSKEMARQALGLPAKKHRNTPKNIPLELLLEYWDKGLSTKEIAGLCGCSEANVKTRLSKELGSLRAANALERHGATVLRIHQSKILNAITAKDLKKASLLQKTTAFGTLFDKERLILGKSTQNVAYADVVELRKQKEKEVVEIEKQIFDMTPVKERGKIKFVQDQQ